MTHRRGLLKGIFNLQVLSKCASGSAKLHRYGNASLSLNETRVKDLHQPDIFDSKRQAEKGDVVPDVLWFVDLTKM